MIFEELEIGLFQYTVALGSKTSQPPPSFLLSFFPHSFSYFPQVSSDFFILFSITSSHFLVSPTPFLRYTMDRRVTGDLLILFLFLLNEVHRKRSSFFEKMSQNVAISVEGKVGLFLSWNFLKSLVPIDWYPFILSFYYLYRYLVASWKTRFE